MKKSVKIVLCSLVAMVVVSGCAKEEATTTETTVASGETVAEEVVDIDPGTIVSLGEYKGLEVTAISTEVTDEELEAQIQSMLAMYPEEVEVTDRAAQNGDVVNIDYEGKKDGVAFTGGTAQGYDLTLGSNSFIDGFEAGLVGAKVGETLDLDLTFPEVYQSEELAGQAVVFTITVNSITEEKEAVFDDAFAQRVSDFQTADELEADTLAWMIEDKEYQATQTMENEAFLKAIEVAEFAVNEEAVEAQYESQLSYYTQMTQMYGMELADFVAMYGMTEDDFKAELRTSAETAIKQQILAEAIAEAEGLVVEDADLDELAVLYGTTKEDLKATYGDEAVEDTAIVFKVVEFLLENATIK